MATRKHPTKNPTKVELFASIEDLKRDYDSLAPTLERLRLGLVEQLSKVVNDNSLTLAFPIESRIKSWASISEKLDRKSLTPKSIVDLPDLIGIRIVFLFLRDLQTSRSAVTETFSVKDMEDVSGRLGDAQFGYQSVHYGITIPDSWQSVPTFSGCLGISAELQLRTIAQHTWAAASHILQYKQETSVPLEVRRSIHRVSALLETVDLEFERALEEREKYLQEPTETRSGDELLNVDLLAATLDSLLPLANKEDDESYDELLDELSNIGIDSLEKLRQLIGRHLAETLKHDAGIVSGAVRGYGREPERIAKAVYLAHTGLLRHMIELEKGKKIPFKRRPRR